MQWLGFPSTEPTEPIRLLTDLCLIRDACSSGYVSQALPETLLQAFSTEALAAGDSRYIDRELQSTRLLAAVDLWRSGRSAMVAVTGPQGCGMTSFLRQMEQQVGADNNCRYSQLENRPYDTGDTLALLCTITGCEQACHSIDDAINYINSLEPGIFFIDNGHFLACRIMGANEAIRVFGAVMLATQQRHLWVLGCQEYAWRRLVYVYRADRYFTDRIELPLFNEDELGLCLTTRLQVSGMALNSATQNDDDPVPAELTRHLPALHKLSNGKPDFAFFYFLSSLLVNAGNGALDMQTVVALDFGALKQLISEELFTLAEVAAHGQLSINDHRAMFRISHEQSLLILQRLFHQCLLDRNETEKGVTFCLAPQYSDVVTRYLTNANYLY